jgi:hypothetical protein
MMGSAGARAKTLNGPVAVDEVEAAGELLLGCLRRALGNAAGVRAPELTEAEWESVAAEALRQRVGPLTYRSTLGGNVPRHVVEQLRDVYIRHAFRNRQILSEVARIGAGLRLRDVPVMLLKGAALAADVYDDPALRPMADVDILVPPDRLHEAAESIAASGYEPSDGRSIEQFISWCHHISPYVKDGVPTVEIHWTIERPTSPFTIDLDGLWQRARSIRIDGEAVFTPAAEDMVLHHALHTSYHHRFSRAALKTLCDVCAVIGDAGERFDWRSLVAIANAAGAGPFIYCSLRLAAAMLACPVPAHVFESLDHSEEDDAMFAAARHYVVTPPIELPVTYEEMNEHAGLRGKMRVLREAFFPSPRKIREIYALPEGSRRTLFYYFVRPVDLMVRRGRIAIEVLLRTERVRPSLERQQNRSRIKQWVDNANRR